jgi:hypothetical protein
MPAERRAWPRRVFAGGCLPPPARIRPGTPVVIVNLSTRGTLIEGSLRLRPGGRCEFQFTTPEGEVIAAARVARCFVARLAASMVRYRAALAFDQPIALPPEQELLAGYQLPARPPQSPAVGVAASRAAGAARVRPAFRPEMPRGGRR